MDRNGVINVYKEAGFTSHDVVAKLRGILHQKKIGHTGTLDPDAQGVLPICLGKATRLCDMLADHDKVYEAVLCLGITTDTQDMSGRILQEREVFVGEAQIAACIQSFVGEQMQVPPMYSAIKINGKKLYELAREGKEVERKARKVFFHEIEILSMELPEVTIRVHCSKGTYIRTLCHDIGETLGCGGCMKTLLRTRVERFTLEEAKTLGDIQRMADDGTLDKILIPVDEMFSQYPKCSVNEAGDKLVHNGNRILQEHLLGEEKAAEQNEWIRIYDSKDEFIGIFEKIGAYFTPVKMFYQKK